MKKVVSLFLPTWPTDRLYRLRGTSAPPRDKPLVLASTDGRAKVVYALNLSARRAGLSTGMSITQAQALIPGLEIQLADPAGDLAGLDRLGLWALRRYSPLVAPDPPAGLVFDASGVTHLYKGEAAMLEDVATRLASSGIAARCAMAPTWGAAHAFARHKPATTLIYSHPKMADALAGLPVSALRLDSETIQQLRRLGLDTLAELNATPRAPLAHRFGPELLHCIDRLYGRTAEPFIPLEAPDIPSVTRAFAEPISAPETLHRYMTKLAEQMAVDLEAKMQGASQLDLTFARIDSRIEAVRVGFSQATREARRFIQHLARRLETIDPGPGVERMTLTASRIDALPFRPGAVLGEQPERDVSELIDTLTSRIGESRLYRLAAVESEMPERSVTRIPPLAEATDLRWPQDWPRPSRLLPHPEPVETMALLPDHPPVHFTWRGIRHRIKRADGPERIFGEWIRSNAELFAVRDYFVVEDDAGERFWLFRAGDGEQAGTGSQRWYIHGVFG